MSGKPNDATEDAPEGTEGDELSPAEAAAAEEDAAWKEAEREARGEDPPEDDAADEPDTEDDDPPAQDAGGEGEEPEPEEPAEGSDIDWSKADPALRAEYEAIQSRLNAAEHGRKTAEGRARAAQRNLDAVMADGREPSANRSKSDPKETQADEGSQKWDAFKADYPEIAEAVGPIIDNLRAEIGKRDDQIARLATGMQSIGQDRLQARSTEYETLVREAHPDYDDITDSDQFIGWYEKQPEAIQAIVQANAADITDPDAVDRILTLYKVDEGIRTDDRNGSDAAADKEQPRTRNADSVRRRMQLNSARGAPRSSPGARLPEGRSGETEDDVWNEFERAEKKRIQQERRSAARL